MLCYDGAACTKVSFTAPQTGYSWHWIGTDVKASFSPRTSLAILKSHPPPQHPTFHIFLSSFNYLGRYWFYLFALLSFTLGCKLHKGRDFSLCSLPLYPQPYTQQLEQYLDHMRYTVNTYWMMNDFILSVKSQALWWTLTKQKWNRKTRSLTS